MDGGKDKELSFTHFFLFSFFLSCLSNSSNVVGHVQHIKGQGTCIIHSRDPAFLVVLLFSHMKAISLE